MPPTGKQLAKHSKGYIFLIDWTSIANCSYERTVAELGPSIAKNVANVITSFAWDPEKIEIIGHSVGGHIAGYIGAALNGKIRRITGTKIFIRRFLNSSNHRDYYH